MGIPAKINPVSLLDPTAVYPPPSTAFASELRGALGPFRSALVKLLSELGAPKSPTALNRLSNAGLTNCWRVFRIVQAADVVAEARHAPTPASLKRLLDAAGTAGVSDQTIAAVRTTAENFQAFSKRAAGDRTAFDSMLVGAGSEASTGEILFSQRRTAYRSMSHLWGSQTDLHYFSTLMRRSEIGIGADEVTLTVQRGVQLLRSGATTTLFGHRRTPGHTPGERQRDGSLDTDAANRYGMPLLPEFSSKPLPEVETVELPTGWVLRNTLAREVGTRGSFDCAFGRKSYNVPFMQDNDGRKLFASTFSHIRKPVALAVMELLIHRPSFPDVFPELLSFQYQEGNVTQEMARKAMRFPIDERITHEGPADSVELAEVPRYSEMLRFAVDRVGWDLSEFHVYRLRMPFPIMFSATRMFFYVD